jgi:hypothetical protein
MRHTLRAADQPGAFCANTVSPNYPVVNPQLQRYRREPGVAVSTILYVALQVKAIDCLCK